MISILEINQLLLDVFLGWSEDERREPQTVSFDIRIEWKYLLNACNTDRLEDSLCYFKISECLKKNLQGREFKLIEHLAHETFCSVEKILLPDAKLEVRVTKVNPPIAELHGGASFTLKREEPWK